jgi:hypothetical protein
VNRYFTMTDAGEGGAPTLEDTVESEGEDAILREPWHRHFDDVADMMPPGTVFASRGRHLSGLRRRKVDRLGVARVPFFEPVGAKRECFYEQKVALTLPWHCPAKPAVVEGGVRWSFVWDPPNTAALGGADVPRQEFVLAPGASAVCFEQLASDIEKELCRQDHALVCKCCLGELGTLCRPCRFAVGLHRCANPQGPRHLRWRKGSLYGGALDVQRCIFNLHRKGLPTDVLREKACAYEGSGLLTADASQLVMSSIEPRPRFAAGVFVRLVWWRVFVKRCGI